MAGENLGSVTQAAADGDGSAPLASDAQQAALRALCDTFVPSIEHPDDGDGFWARTATDVGADQGILQILATLPDADRAGILQLLDALFLQNLPNVSQRSREQVLRNVALASPEAGAGLAALSSLTMFFTYGGPDPVTGQNPNWRRWGYPGPVSPTPDVPKPIEPLVPVGDTELEADVCVVGSGAGGGVIAGTLAKQGLKVVVLEAGGYYNEADFNQLELWAYQNLYYRGGPTPTAEQTISMQAGATLGGGTTVNWTNCLRTHPWVRAEWAQEYGLEGVDTPDYDRHLDVVMERISANDRCSDLNGPHQRIKEASDKLGHHVHVCVRNTDESSYSPELAAYMGFGDQTGSKQSTTKTFLQDAYDEGADIVVRCSARKVLVEDGRAAGVEALYSDPATGREARVTVRAPQVVVAGGALESPALLLRSGIGGPAVGRYLRLHPTVAVFGKYDEDQKAWWGTPQALVNDHFADVEDGYGFLVEGAQYAPAITGAAVPWTGAYDHKEVLADNRYGASFIAVTRDHGHGWIELDTDGEPVHHYVIEDELDLRNLRHAIAELARLHEAAGATEIFHLAAGLPHWKRGEDGLESFIAKAQAVPFVAGGQKVFTAHQMGSCRMGTDPEVSVAGPYGELHDTAGVWIGDGSAFPTPSGTNPMISIMALAHRTAEAVAEAAGAGRPLEAAAAQPS